MCVFRINHLQYLVVDNLCCCLQVKMGRWNWYSDCYNNRCLATCRSYCVCNHAISTLCCTLKVVHRSCRYVTCEQFLSARPPSNAHISSSICSFVVIWRSSGRYHAAPKSLTTWYNTYLYKRVCMFAEPAYLACPAS